MKRPSTDACLSEIDHLRELVSTLTAENSRLQAVYDLVSMSTHVCSGRDCIGYRLPWDSATQHRCNYCSKMRKAMGIDSDSTRQVQPAACESERFTRDEIKAAVSEEHEPCKHPNAIQYGREIECPDCQDKWEEPQT